MTGGSVCEASTWISDSGVKCRVSAGVGGGWPLRPGQGLPIFMSVALQQGSLTQAWCYDVVAIRGLIGSSNGACSGDSYVIVSGIRFGNSGFSGGSRLGRSGATDDMNGGSSCRASLWQSDSGLVCKSSSGVGVEARRGFGLPIVVSIGLQRGSLTQAWSYDVTVVKSVSFIIANSDRLAGKSAVPITLAFTPTTPISSGGTVTLTYPPNFRL